MRKKIRIFLIFLIFCAMGICGFIRDEPNSDMILIYINEAAMFQQFDFIQTPYQYSKFEIEQFYKEEIEEVQLSDEDINLIALVTMAEAEGESEYGNRLVIDTILNRVDSSYYPDTVHEVVYQPNQFSSMWNGRINKCYVMDKIRQLVKEELKQRKNYEVIFFTAGDYGKYGTPMFQEGNHYFSSYE